MKTIGKLGMVASIAALALGSAGIVKANEFGVDGTSGTLDFTSPSTFTLTDSLFDVSGLTSEGTLDLTGDYTASGSSYKLTNVDATEGGVSLLSNAAGEIDQLSTGPTLVFAAATPTDKLALTATTYSTTATGFSFPQIGGSYTGVATAPEVSSSAALAAMLFVGGALYFSGKRKASSTNA